MPVYIKEITRIKKTNKKGEEKITEKLENIHVIREDSTSQWYPFKMYDNLPIRIHDNVYPNLGFVYNLFKLSDNPMLQSNIITLLKSANPKEIQKYFKKIKSPEQSFFSMDKSKVLEWLLRMKFAQHYTYVAGHFIEDKDNVISIYNNRIENKDIVYYTKDEDTFLGTKENETQFTGQNHYGIIISKLRDEFRNNPESLKRVEKPAIDCLKIVGQDCNVGYLRKDDMVNIL